VAETRFTAMGSTAHVIVSGDPSVLHVARTRIEQLERMWSRFDPWSELSRLNAFRHLRVSWETLELVERSIEGWRITGGRFDPTVHDALVAHGYDRTLALAGAGRRPDVAIPSPGCSGIVIDRTASSISLPAGVNLDPGGIGKGLAADLTVGELLDRGADGALVNLGGDLRAEGSSPEGPGWSVALEGPPGGPSPGVVSFVAGGVASSTPLKRRWDVGHHLIDPVLGSPIEHPHRFVAAVASEAWRAEIATKDLLGRDVGAEPLDGVAALVVAADGTVHRSGGMEAYL